jgi:hypothetical protein
MDLFGIDHYHEISCIHVRGEARKMFSPEPHGNVGCHPAQHLILGINQKPFTLFWLKLGTNCFH